MTAVITPVANAIDASIYDTNANLRQLDNHHCNPMEVATVVPPPPPLPPTASLRLTISVTGTVRLTRVTGNVLTVSAQRMQAGTGLLALVPLGTVSHSCPNSHHRQVRTAMTVSSTPASGYTTDSNCSAGYRQVTATVTVAAPAALGSLTLTAVGARVGTQQQIQVTVRNSVGTLAIGGVTVTLTGAANPPTVSTLNGSGAVIATLPTATGAHTLTCQCHGICFKFGYNTGVRTGGYATGYATGYAYRLRHRLRHQ